MGQHDAELFVVVFAGGTNREFGLEQHEHNEDEESALVVVVVVMAVVEFRLADDGGATITGMMVEKSPSSTRLKLSGLMSSSA